MCAERSVVKMVPSEGVACGELMGGDKSDASGDIMWRGRRRSIMEKRSGFETEKSYGNDHDHELFWW